VEECLDELKDTCLHRIREAFEREKSIPTTHQTHQFQEYKVLYEEHYTAMYRLHVGLPDFPFTPGDPVLEKMDEVAPIPQKNPLLVPNRRDILGIVRQRDLPVERQALLIMAEVRSYYDCK
jgi:hypothetical protein